ncbi:hypothetical protein ACP4OV_001347 [Aristida adscensionis]
MASFLHLSSLLVLVCLTYLLQVVAAEQHHTISVEALLSSALCSPAAAAPVNSASHPGGGSTLQILRRPCPSKGDDELITVSDHYNTILRRDHHRLRSIHRRLAVADEPNGPTTTIPARLGLPFHSLEYVVTVGVGTPPRNLTVLFDTGSDLTWVQCTACAATATCRPQDEPLFDPAGSSSYSVVSCAAPECAAGGGQTFCAGTQCRYRLQYGDGSRAGGDLARETVALSPGAPLATGIVFGCGDVSTDFGGMTLAGLLGLGRGAWSIVSQTRDSNGGVFSYCLPPHGGATGYLAFGAATAAAQQPSHGTTTSLQFTPLKPSPTFYAVDLTGILVDGAALPIPAAAFSAGAVIVDSGTVITSLQSGAYHALRDEFRRHMAGYTPVTLEGPVDTCYDVTGRDVVSVPRVALEFAGGARIDVDASGILIVAADSGVSVACLAFGQLPPDVQGISAIIGNMQQRKHTVVFDELGVHGGETCLEICDVSLTTGADHLAFLSPKVYSSKIRVFHQHGPCSPNAHPAMDYHRDILHSDKSRVDTLHRRFSEDSNGTTRGYISGLDVETLDYAAVVGYGSPKVDTKVYLDIASDLSWIMCGESYCKRSEYFHHGECFYPSKSSTFRETLNLTNRLHEGFSDDGYYEMINAYDQRGGIRTGCDGYLSNETLTLTPSIVLKDFMFGCSSLPSDRPLFDHVVGVMGLGRGSLSIGSQGDKSINGTFSYCLPSLNGMNGFLKFGDHQEQQQPGMVQFTPLLKNPTAPSYYFVDLVGLSVGRKNLSIPPGAFRDVGTILDTGTTATYLPEAAYMALRAEFDAWVRRYATSVSGFAHLDSCYDFGELKEITIPTVALLFGGGVKLELPPTAVLYYIGSTKYCLAFAPTSDSEKFSVIGNVQQRSTEVIYDLGEGMVGFVPGRC